jgi:hypothetical protein
VDAGFLKRSCCTKRLERGDDSQRSHHALVWWIGAWRWFRANLSAFSARRFHQISFPGDWCGRRESNTLHRSGAERSQQKWNPVLRLNALKLNKKARFPGG